MCTSANTYCIPSSACHPITHRFYRRQPSPSTGSLNRSHRAPHPPVSVRARRTHPYAVCYLVYCIVCTCYCYKVSRVLSFAHLSPSMCYNGHDPLCFVLRQTAPSLALITTVNVFSRCLRTCSMGVAAPTRQANCCTPRFKHRHMFGKLSPLSILVSSPAS